MIERVFEGLIIILFIIFLFFLFLNKFIYTYKIYYKEINIGYEFIKGRVIMKILTENISYPICNLSVYFFNLIENSSLTYQFFGNYSIYPPYYIFIENLYNTSENYTVDEGYENNFEFNRVCYFNGSLYLIRIIT